MQLKRRRIGISTPDTGSSFLPPRLIGLVSDAALAKITTKTTCKLLWRVKVGTNVGQSSGYFSVGVANRQHKAYLQVLDNEELQKPQYYRL